RTGHITRTCPSPIAPRHNATTHLGVVWLPWSDSHTTRSDHAEARFTNRHRNRGSGSSGQNRRRSRASGEEETVDATGSVAGFALTAAVAGPAFGHVRPPFPGDRFSLALPPVSGVCSRRGGRRGSTRPLRWSAPTT